WPGSGRSSGRRAARGRPCSTRPLPRPSSPAACPPPHSALGGRRRRGRRRPRPFVYSPGALIDDHAHPFDLEPGPFDPSALSLDVHDDAGLQERRRSLGPTRLAQELLVSRLARWLGCRPEEVLGARAEAARDWGAYVSAL